MRSERNRPEGKGDIVEDLRTDTPIRRSHAPSSAPTSIPSRKSSLRKYVRWAVGRILVSSVKFGPTLWGKSSRGSTHISSCLDTHHRGVIARDWNLAKVPTLDRKAALSTANHSNLSFSTRSTVAGLMNFRSLGCQSDTEFSQPAVTSVLERHEN
jgi:hypothetical protein